MRRVKELIVLMAEQVLSSVRLPPVLCSSVTMPSGSLW